MSLDNMQKETGRQLKENGHYINRADYLEGATTDFGEIRTSQRYPQLTLNAGLPLSDRRDYTLNSANGGGVELVGGEYRVYATASAGSVGATYTRQRANYLSGGVLEGGIGLRVPVQPTGSAEVNWGFQEYDGTTAIQLSYQSDGIHFQIINDGTTEVDVAQTDWNVDKLDGTGPSGYTLDLSDGYVFQIPFIYYGYGDIRCQIMVTVNGRKRVIDVHRESRDGQISIDRANLPLCVEVIGDGTALEAFLGGRQVNSTLPDQVRPRFTSGRVLNASVGDTIVPLVSFRHKTGFKDIFCTLDSLEIITDGDLIVEIQRGGTLTDATFDYTGNQSASEMALEYDIDATAITGGETIYDTFALGGQGNKPASRPSDIPAKYISEFDITSVVARTKSGTANVDVIARNLEKW